LSQRSLQLDASPRVSPKRLRWTGPALAVAGLFAAAAVALMANRSAFAGWFLPYALAPERVLPLIGFGVACGLVRARMLAVALALFGLGIAFGTAVHLWLILTIYNLLEGTTHLSLTSPVGCLVIGLALVPGARLLPWLLPIAAFVEGVTLALAVFLTDPSLHDPLFIWTPLLAATWIVLAIALTLKAFQRGWTAIFGRILGSWMVAVGVLYGGTSLLPILKPPPPPTDTSQESTRGAELNQSIQPSAGSERLERVQPQPGAFSGGVERLPP
jgi:hypothetical protein